MNRNLYSKIKKGSRYTCATPGVKTDLKSMCETEKAVLGLLIEDSDRTAEMIATEIGVTKK